MSSVKGQDAAAQIREMITRLQSPISDISELLSYLSWPLDVIGLLPPAFRTFKNDALPPDAKDAFRVVKHIPPIQSAILESIAPTWEKTLREQGYDGILYQYFSPDAFSSLLQASGEVALLAYTSVLSSALTQFSIKVLQRLARQYPIDRLHSVVYSRPSTVPSHRKDSTWEEAVQSAVSVPTKLANKSDVLEIPPELEPREYYSSLCVRFEILVASFQRRPDTGKSYALLLTSAYSRFYRNHFVVVISLDETNKCWFVPEYGVALAISDELSIYHTFYHQDPDRIVFG